MHSRVFESCNSSSFFVSLSGDGYLFISHIWFTQLCVKIFIVQRELAVFRFCGEYTFFRPNAHLYGRSAFSNAFLKTLVRRLTTLMCNTWFSQYAIDMKSVLCKLHWKCHSLTVYHKYEWHSTTSSRFHSLHVCLLATCTDKYWIYSTQ